MYRYENEYNFARNILPKAIFLPILKSGYDMSVGVHFGSQYLLWPSVTVHDEVIWDVFSSPEGDVKKSVLIKREIKRCGSW